MDAFVVASIVLTFAALCTIHVAVAVALALRGPWWRGALALVLVPLAPYWAFQDKLRGRAFAWLGALLAYVAARVAAVVVSG